ncbi:hypothetical protein [Larkinella soli]|uniref:hypothetical protein n=1 Tax=Larkinella soli TaxID=1770527 RepID=UPI000FFBD2F7|nr:hypothetical protein [Larkinella soli]
MPEIVDTRFEPGQLALYPYLYDPMTLPAGRLYGAYPLLHPDNNKYYTVGVTHLDHSGWGFDNTKRATSHKITGANVMKNNGANVSGAANMTRTQVRNAANQSACTFFFGNQNQEGEYYVAAGSNQAFWYNERIQEIQLADFGANAINYGSYGDTSMYNADTLVASNALSSSFVNRYANATAAKASIPFFNNTYTAMDGSTKTLADVHTAANIRLYPQQPYNNNALVHRAMHVEDCYVIAGWTKYIVWFVWPPYESVGESIAHSGWPYVFRTTNPAGKVEAFGHLHIPTSQAVAMGFWAMQGAPGADKKGLVPFSQGGRGTADINKQHAFGIWYGGKPLERWTPDPGSPSSFPWTSEGQLGYSQEPNKGHDGYHSGVTRWKKSYDALGGYGTKAYAQVSYDGGATWKDPGSSPYILYMLSQKAGIAETEVLSGKIKVCFYDPFLPPKKAQPGIRIKHMATGQVFAFTKPVVGNETKAEVFNL